MPSRRYHFARRKHEAAESEPATLAVKHNTMIFNALVVIVVLSLHAHGSWWLSRLCWCRRPLPQAAHRRLLILARPTSFQRCSSPHSTSFVRVPACTGAHGAREAVSAIELDCRYEQAPITGGVSTCSGKEYTLSEETCCWDDTVATDNICAGGSDCDGGKIFTTEPGFSCCAGKYLAVAGDQVCCGGEVSDYCQQTVGTQATAVFRGGSPCRPQISSR